MKLFVLSDTHGNLEKVYHVYKELSAIDAIIHLGDCHEDALQIQNDLCIDVISVKGNMDNAYGRHEFKIIETECGKLYLSHGHMENVKMTYQNIYYRALEENCIAALFGHTHKPVFENLNDILLINPGSLSLPSDGSSGSYAVINTSADGISGEIHYYSEHIKKTPSPKPASKVRGGFIRGLLNYSDRF